jgi:rifampicin phosphotransferase
MSDPAPPDARARRGHDQAAVRLDGHADPTEVGGKAAALDRLLDWGFPVPVTGVVTASAYRRWAAHPDIRRLVDDGRAGTHRTVDDVNAVCASVPLDYADGLAIAALALDVAGDGKLAVRSSATIEDLAGSSFAGQYTSVLDVDPADADAVLAAVRKVFSSLWHPAPCAYRSARGVDDGDAAMAVVLQRMIDAVRAGVIFTRDPTSGGDAARVEWVDGMGEALVSGQQTPTVRVVPLGEPEAGTATTRLQDTTEPEVRRAVELALGVEERAGGPQDVEWAWDGTQVWLVQARPITAGFPSARSRADVPAGPAQGDGFDDSPEVVEGCELTTAGIGESLPGVLPPLVWTTARHLVEEAFRNLLGDLGLLSPELVDRSGVVRRVRGRAALDYRQVASTLPGAAEALESAYFRTTPTPHGSVSGATPTPGKGPGGASTRQRRRRLRSAAHDVRVLAARRRSAIDAACTSVAVEVLCGAPPALESMTDGDVLAYHLRLLDLAGRAATAELGVAADAVASHGRLGVHLERCVKGRGAMLADQVVAGAAVIVSPSPTASMSVVAGPTWIEAGIVPPQFAGDSERDVREAAALDHLAEAVIDGTGSDASTWMLWWRVKVARRLAQEAIGRLSLRERAKQGLLCIGGELRRVHHEMGRRLVDRGALERATDVELVGVEEIRGWMAGATTVSGEDLARRRTAQHLYADQPPLPDRFVAGQDDRGRDRSLPASVQSPVGEVLSGWAASPGWYQGVARVLHDASDELADGEVLVADAVDPSWSPLFLRAGAIVLSRGGPLSHAAILARELGVPAVMHVAESHEVLDGRLVTVDGNEGIVTIHALPPDALPPDASPPDLGQRTGERS